MKTSDKICILVMLGTMVSIGLNLNDRTAAGAASDGGKIFSENCAGCHANGGNQLDPKKPVKGSKELATKQGFKDLLNKPKGAMMTPFPQIAKNDADLTALYNYCKSLK